MNCEQKIYTAHVFRKDEIFPYQNKFHIFFPSGATEVNKILRSS